MPIIWFSILKLYLFRNVSNNHVAYVEELVGLAIEVIITLSSSRKAGGGKVHVTLLKMIFWNSNSIDFLAMQTSASWSFTSLTKIKLSVVTCWPRIVRLLRTRASTPRQFCKSVFAILWIFVVIPERKLQTVMKNALQQIDGGSKRTVCGPSPVVSSHQETKHLVICYGYEKDSNRKWSITSI